MRGSETLEESVGYASLECFLVANQEGRVLWGSKAS